MNLQQVEKLLQEDVKVPWHRYIARGGHPALLLDIIHTSNMLLPKVIGLPPLTFWKRFGDASYFSEIELQKVKKGIRDCLEKNPHSFLEKIENLETILDNGVKWAEKQSTKRIRSEATLKNFKKEFITHYQLMWTSAYLPMITDDVIKDFLDQLKIDPRALRPLSLTEQQIMQNSLYETRKQYGSHPPKTVLEKLAGQYGWFRSYIFLIRPYSVKDVFEDLKNAKYTKSPSAERSTGKKRVYSTIARKMIDFRDRRIINGTQFIYYTKPVLEYWAKTLGLIYEDFIHFTADELEQRSLDRKELEERKIDRAYLVLRGKGYIFSGKNLALFMQVQEKDMSASELKGRSAYPGCVHGVVRRVTPYTYDQIQPGDIIVTGMTTPEIASFAKNIRAIVTDEGGITAHAAIIAREFKIPTVVGTKIATQALTTGDRVEVDAERGTVTKLSANARNPERSRRANNGVIIKL